MLVTAVTMAVVIVLACALGLWRRPRGGDRRIAPRRHRAVPVRSVAEAVEEALV